MPNSEHRSGAALSLLELCPRARTAAPRPQRLDTSQGPSAPGSVGAPARGSLGSNARPRVSPASRRRASLPTRVGAQAGSFPAATARPLCSRMPERPARSPGDPRWCHRPSGRFLSPQTHWRRVPSRRRAPPSSQGRGGAARGTQVPAGSRSPTPGGASRPAPGTETRGGHGGTPVSRGGKGTRTWPQAERPGYQEAPGQVHGRAAGSGQVRSGRRAEPLCARRLPARRGGSGRAERGEGRGLRCRPAPRQARPLCHLGGRRAAARRPPRLAPSPHATLA